MNKTSHHLSITLPKPPLPLSSLSETAAALFLLSTFPDFCCFSISLPFLPHNQFAQHASGFFWILIISVLFLIIRSVECVDVRLVIVQSAVSDTLVVLWGRVCLCDWGGKTVHSLRAGDPKRVQMPSEWSTNSWERSKRGFLVFVLGAKPVRITVHVNAEIFTHRNKTLWCVRFWHNVNKFIANSLASFF